VIGTLLLGGVQQWASVSRIFEGYPQVNVLLVGLVLVLFVVAAPNGIVGLVQAWRRKRPA